MLQDDSRFRSPAQTTPQAWEKLRDYLVRQGHTLELEPAPRQFAGGLANLNYYVHFDGAPAVLRRPPPGPLALGANDMAREWSVTSKLWKSYPLAPRGLLFCADSAVIGAPFLLSEYREGLVVRDELPPGSQAADLGPRLVRSLADSLARLHALDPQAAGLGDLGRPENFLPRQVRGWAKRGEASYDNQMPTSLTAALQRLAAWQAPPDDNRLVHTDFKLDNLILDPDTYEPRAVVDWDMTTRGDPLYDLAILLSYWVERDDPQGLHDLRQLPSLAPGFPRRDDMIAAYQQAAQREIPDMRMYLLLARVRLGIAWRQLYVQYRRGSLLDRRYAQFDALASAIFEFALEGATHA
jgi:aminoglycoside phosphotransferase (APT) family kinase protein